MIFQFTINDPQNPLSKIQVKGSVLTIYLRCKTYNDPNSSRLLSYITTKPAGRGETTVVDAHKPEHKELHINDAEKEMMHFHLKHEFEFKEADSILMSLNQVLLPFYLNFPKAERIDYDIFSAQFEEYQQKEAAEKTSISEASTPTSNLNILTGNRAKLFSSNAEIKESSLSEEFANRLGL